MRAIAYKHIEPLHVDVDIMNANWRKMFFNTNR